MEIKDPSPKEILIKIIKMCNNDETEYIQPQSLEIWPTQDIVDAVNGVAKEYGYSEIVESHEEGKIRVKDVTTLLELSIAML